MTRENPYKRLKRTASQAFLDTLCRSDFIWRRYKNATDSRRAWALAPLHAQVLLADELGYEFVLQANGDDLEVVRRKKRPRTYEEAKRAMPLELK